MVVQAFLPRLARRFVEKGGDPSRWPERMGHDPDARPGGPVIWVHAVSIGEMTSALPLVDALLDARPDATILMTTTTSSAGALAEARLPPGAVHRFAPLDLREAVRRFLDHWRPERAIFLESEIWPVQIMELKARGIPFALVSARLTDRSTERWRRYAPGLARALFSEMSLVLAQDEETAGRARALGAPRVDVAGSLKAAARPLPLNGAARNALLRATSARPVWVAASTHPGEEEEVVAAHRTICRRNPATLLILAPRHPERAPAILDLLDGLNVAQRSRGSLPCPETEIYLADTLGEMGLWYDRAPIVFLGGSLKPGIGGHNPLEPAAFGCAILTGPHTDNTRAEFDRLLAAGAAIRVSGPAELARGVARLLTDGASAMGAKAREAVGETGVAMQVATACLAL